MAQEDAQQQQPEAEPEAELAELRRLRSTCTSLATQLHDLSHTRSQLSAQVSLLATEAVEAGCRGELWITHEGKSNESRFHRVVGSSQIICGREYGDGGGEEEEMGHAAVGDGTVGGSAAKRRVGTSHVAAADTSSSARTGMAPPVAASSSPQKRPSDEVDGPSTAITEGSGGHLPQKKRKVEVEVEMPRNETKQKGEKPIDPATGLEDLGMFFRTDESSDAVAASTNSAVPPAPPIAPPSCPPPAPPIAPPTASPPAKIKTKDGIRQDPGGKWSASILHSNDQSYDLGASFDTPGLATLALGAFRSTLANESRAAGGRISDEMVTQARWMARQAVVSAASQGGDQKM